ncbi:FAD/NAD(P)-binding protein [Iodobacter fluviatilis]|uniref:FAD/NAD(P)-binding protein n=1 Tax=Iodobacter fluviatilis TaxID=537 RepID=UPI001405239D|nr:FAD/NAD(P)-binding protein [Iodobacter fluviatilis]
MKTKQAVQIAIIGMGPRGLTVLERIIAHALAKTTQDLLIYLFDPRDPGSGCHWPSQPDHLLVNSVAGQITQFADETVKDAGPILGGPSFYQWLTDSQGAEGAAAICPDAYYSRSMFGEYLQWVYHYLLHLAPANLKVVFCKEPIKSVQRQADGAWTLLTETSESFQADYFFLTTGHTKPKPPHVHQAGPAIVTDPYPIAEKLAFIPADCTVAIEGLGLSTFDIFSYLTVGRGGRFVRAAVTGALQYIPSGQEPKICAFSRSGLPLSARAINQKGVSGQYRPRFLTMDKVLELRKTGPLDFVKSILPLLLNDMKYAYYEAYFKQKKGHIAAMLFCNRFVFATCAEERQKLIAEQVPVHEQFSWEQLVSPVAAEALQSHENFKTWLMMYLGQDIFEAQQGNINSPIKAASDVLRDLRDHLRAAIDFAGLTEASHRWLYSSFLPVMNRVAVGPPKERIEEMLALMQAGVLTADFGPGAECKKEGDSLILSAKRWPQQCKVDVLIKARVSMHSPKDDESSLLQQLLKSGQARLFYNGSFHPGGMDVDRNFNLIAADGSPVTNAWALGIPTEGAKFYTFVVPRPGVNSTAVVDAGRAVAQMLSMVEKNHARSKEVVYAE